MDHAAELILVPAVLVNLWHGYLLAFTWPKKPPTISEHALISSRRLLAHRLVHCLSSVALLIYAYINRSIFGPITILLVAGATFDIIEVLTLHQDISKSPIDFSDRHQLTSWLMANSYMLFVILAGVHTHISPTLTITFIGIYTGLFLISVRSKFKNFWAIQMTYFVVLALNMIILSSHI